MATDKNNDLEKSIDHLDKDLEKLDDSIEKLDSTLEKSIKSHGFIPTFFRGIIGALGAAIGGAIVIALLVYILRQLVDWPVIGDTINSFLNLIQQNK